MNLVNRFGYAFVLLTSALFPAAAADCVGSWQTKASGALPRRNLAVSAAGSIVYAGGGAAPNSSSSVNSFEAYDTLNNNWTTKAPLPIATQGARAAEIDGLLYVVGGGTAGSPLGSLQVYNPANNNWAVKTSMPTPRYYPVAAAVGGLLYVAGGSSGHGAIYNTLEVYDPADDSWTPKAPLPAARSGSGVAVVDGIIYVIGGGADTYEATLFAYNPGSNTWETKAPLPTPLASPAVAAVNGIIFVIGGDSASGALQSVYAYNPAANNWSPNTALPTVQNVMGAAAIGNTIYVSRCAYPAFPNTSVQTIEAFSLSCPPPIQDVSLYLVEKSRWYAQTSASETRPATQSPGLFGRIVNGSFGFLAEVIVNPGGSVSSASLFEPGGAVAQSLQPAPGSATLFLSGEFASAVDLDAEYPFGVYNLTMTTDHNGVIEVNLNLDGRTYPNPPRLTNFDAAQSVVATSDFTLSWTPFADGRPGDAIIVRLYDESSQIIFEAPLFDFDTTSLTIPANTLAPGMHYHAQLLFFATADFNSATYPGAFGVADYTSITTAPIATFNPVVTPLPPGAFPIAATLQSEFSLSAAFDGANYLVAYQGGPAGPEQTMAQFVSAAGTLVGSPIVVGSSGSFPMVAFDGTNFLIVWASSGPEIDLYGQFLSRSGEQVRPAFLINGVIGRQRFDSIDALIFDGANYFLTWRDQRASPDRVYGQFIHPNGTLSGGEILISPSDQKSNSPAACFDGEKILVVWQMERPGGGELYDVYGRFIARAGAPMGGPFLISQNPSKSHNPSAIAFDGVNYFVVWPRDIGAGFPEPTYWDIYARSLTKDGAAIGNEFPITTAPGDQPFGTVRAAQAGGAFMVNWFDIPSGAVVTRFFNPLGAPVSSETSRFGPRNGKTPVAIITSGANGKALLVTSYVDDSFRGEGVYGLLLDLSPPDRSVGVRKSGANLEIFWSTNLPDFHLEFATEVGATANWQPTATPTTLTATEYVVAEPLSATTRFYRLRSN